MLFFLKKNYGKSLNYPKGIPLGANHDHIKSSHSLNESFVLCYATTFTPVARSLAMVSASFAWSIDRVSDRNTRVR